LLDSEFFEKVETKRELGFDPNTPAGKAEMDMRQVQEEREKQGLSPD